jgi:hypothetical protein
MLGNMRDNQKFLDFAESLSGLCSHVDVRDDEDGSYIFALGFKGVHTLQLRLINEQYVVELWHGPDAEHEHVVAEPKFETAEAAFKSAREWLRRDAT